MESYPGPGISWQEGHGVYCPICGCSFESEKNTEPAWLWTSRSVLLDDPTYPDDELSGMAYIHARRDLPIRVWNTHGSGVYGFPLDDQPERNRVFPFQDSVSAVSLSDYPILFIPVHRACFYIVEQFLKYQQYTPCHTEDIDPGKNPPKSLRELFNVLRLRLECGGDEWDSWATWGLHSPRDYYINDQGWDGRFSSPLPLQQHWNFDGQYYNTDPTLLPEGAETMLKPFSPAKAYNATRLDFQRKLECLPTELCDEIIRMVLNDLDGIPEQCTYLMSQNLWKHLLFSTWSFPWLWDRDKVAIAKTDSMSTSISSDAQMLWDWELLVRTLSKQDNFDPEEPSVLPAELRNRRRIWQLLNEMRLGDIIGTRHQNSSGPFSIDPPDDEESHTE